MDNNATYENRWIILVVTLALAFMSNLDASIVNVALPDMAQKLHAGTAGISWVVTIYYLVIVAFIIFFGKLSDLTGKSWIFRAGIILFVIGSLSCGISNNLAFLLSSRVVQGLGAAAAMATSQGIIAEVFPHGERGRALGIFGAAAALGNLSGPPAGGFIVSFWSWHYIFLINIPIGIVFLILGLKYLPHDSEKLHNSKALDLPGSSLFAISMFTIFYSVSNIGIAGEVNLWTFFLLGLGLVLFIWFIFREKRTSKPMLDLKLFGDKLFSLSLLCAFICYAVITGTTFLLPFYIQNLLGFSPHICGLILLTSPMILLIVAPLSGHASDKVGPEILTFFGLAIIGIGLVAMGLFYNHGTAVWLIISIIGLVALGTGLFQSPNTSLIMSHVSKDKLGIASSINALMRYMGMAVGVMISAILLYGIMSARLGYRVLTYISGPQDNAFVFAFRLTMLVLAVMALLGAVLTGIRLIKHKQTAPIQT